MMEILVLWALCGVAAGFIAQSKGRDALGWFFAGVLLGPFGILFAAIASPDTAAVERRQLEDGELRKCPQCAEMIRAEAVRCRYCQSEVAPVAPAPGPAPFCPHCGARLMEGVTTCGSCQRTVALLPDAKGTGLDQVLMALGEPLRREDKGSQVTLHYPRQRLVFYHGRLQVVVPVKRP